MRYFSASIALASTLVVAAPCLAGEASFIVLNTTGASDVVVDEFGRTLVLSSDGLFGGGGIYIFEADANAYNYIGDGNGSSMSADGTVVIASNFNVDGFEEAMRWTESGGWQGLGGLDTCDFFLSSGYDISADGAIAVGLGWGGCSGRAFCWTAETGIVGMESLANGGNRATVISADGTTAAGFAQGTFARTPAMWNVADGAGTLFDIDSQGEISAVSADGNIVAGRYYDDTIEGFYLLPFYRVGQGPIQIIDSLPGFPGGHMFGMSANGRTIVGASGIISEGRNAMVWRAEWGSVSLKEKLIELGIQGLEDAYFEGAWECSADGTKVVGTVILPPPAEGEPVQVRGYVATLPPQIDPVCDEDLDGDGQVGFTDLTQLLGTWGACPGCPEDFDGDGQVGFTDLTQLLGKWGPCA